MLHVIWARGQELGKYVHLPLSGIEKEAASMLDFYQPDEIKYHGHQMQRGVTQINFMAEPQKIVSINNVGSGIDGIVGDENNNNGPAATVEIGHQLNNDCYGFWQYPRDCSPEKLNCEYYASWETILRGDDMRFKIQTTNTVTWTGIGFSNDENMLQTDAIIGWVDKNGRAFMMDTWINDYFGPKLDEHQNIYNTSGSVQNGVTTLEFSRKRMTNDDKDLSFTNDNCLYLMFPVKGGAFNGVNKKIRKHELVPIVTSKRVCIKSCGKDIEHFVETTPAPDRLVYSTAVKLMHLAESFEAPVKNTPEFNDLANRISDSFNGVLNHIPGYHKTDVTGFEK